MEVSITEAMQEKLDNIAVTFEKKGKRKADQQGTIHYLHQGNHDTEFHTWTNNNEIVKQELHMLEHIVLLEHEQLTIDGQDRIDPQLLQAISYLLRRTAVRDAFTQNFLKKVNTILEGLLGDERTAVNSIITKNKLQPIATADEKTHVSAAKPMTFEATTNEPITFDDAPPVTNESKTPHKTILIIMGISLILFAISVYILLTK